MFIVIQNQLAASEKSVQELDAAVETEHEKALIALDVEDLAASAVRLLRTLNADVERWQDAFRPGSASAERFEQTWQDFYRRLGLIAEHALRLAMRVERWGYEIESRTQLLDARREIEGIVCFAPAEVAAAAQEIRSGRGRRLDEVWDELWNRPVNPG